jgi:hypothetical protein
MLGAPGKLALGDAAQPPLRRLTAVQDLTGRGAACRHFRDRCRSPDRTTGIAACSRKRPDPSTRQPEAQLVPAGRRWPRRSVPLQQARRSDRRRNHLCPDDSSRNDHPGCSGGTGHSSSPPHHPRSASKDRAPGPPASRSQHQHWRWFRGVRPRPLSQEDEPFQRSFCYCQERALFDPRQRSRYGKVLHGMTSLRLVGGSVSHGASERGSRVARWLAARTLATCRRGRCLRTSMAQTRRVLDQLREIGLERAPTRRHGSGKPPDRDSG